MQLMTRRNRLTTSSQDLALEGRVMLAATRRTGSVEDTANEFSDSKYSESNVKVIEDSNGRIDQVVSQKQIKDARKAGSPLKTATRKRERFVVKEGENRQPASSGRNNGLDSRVERLFSYNQRGDGRSEPTTLTPRPGTVTFKGYYNIKSAKDTTVFQILSNDPKDKEDPFRPVMFINAETYKTKDGKDRVRLYNIEDKQFKEVKGKRTQVPLYDGPRKFNLEVRSTGKKAEVFIDGKSRGGAYDLDRYRDQSGQQLTDDTILSFRYGAYHHDRRAIKGKRPSNGVTEEAASTADIEVVDARLEA